MAASELDWETVYAGWQSGLSFRACERLVEKRLSATTIRTRAVKAGWKHDDPAVAERAAQKAAQTKAANERTLLRWANERERVVSRLIEVTDHLLNRVTMPHEIIDIRSVGGSKDSAGEVVVTREQISVPLPADQRNLLVSAGIAIDKIQLLTGEATSRAETGPILTDADRKQALAELAGVRDEVAARRGLNGPEKPAASAAV